MDENVKTENFLVSFDAVLSQSSNNQTFITIGGKELLFYGIKPEDRKLWGDMIDHRDNMSIQDIIKAGKIYLLTQVIGNPNDPSVKLLKHNEAAYGNTMLHDRMINAHDQSVIKLVKTDAKKQELLQNSCKASDYLLRYYELKQKNAVTAPLDQAKSKRAEIIKAITFKDAQGKPPLLLACKNLNQSYALRLIKLDENRDTINISDTVENRTPLHIACILGLKEVAQALLALGADTSAVDKYGQKPFYYLSCSSEEKLKNSEDILNSVNFFAGRYFDSNDTKIVCSQLVEKNNILQKELSVATVHENEIPKNTFTQ